MSELSENTLANISNKIQIINKNLSSTETIGTAIKRLAKEAGISVDELYSKIASKMGSAQAIKLKYLVDFETDTDAVKKLRAIEGQINDEINQLKIKDGSMSPADLEKWKILNTQLKNVRSELSELSKDSNRSMKQTFGVASKIISDAAKGSVESRQEAKEIADAERKSIANQREQINIKNRLRQIDHDRAARAKSGEEATKNVVAAENAEYKSLHRTLTRLTAEQKQLNAISHGAGGHARIRLEAYEQSKLTKEAKRYEDVLRRLQAPVNNVKDNFASMIPIIQRIGTAMGVAFSVNGLIQFGKTLVETRGKFEMQFVALKQIIGDADEATRLWNQTLNLSLHSPFTAMQLTDYTKKLAAYRVETDKLFDTTKRLADVSAGLGVDMERLILAYGQVKAANYLRASEVRQMTEAGINIYGELAKYFTEVEGNAVSTAQVVERVTKRMVMFSDVEEIFKRMTEEGGTFFNMQEVQSDTVRGQLMKLRDAYEQMLNTIGEGNQGTIREFVDSLNKLVRNWRDVAYVLKWNVNLVTISMGAFLLLGKKGFKVAGDNAMWFSQKITGATHSLNTMNIFLKKGGTGLTFLQRTMARATVATQSFALGLKSIWTAAWPFLVFEGIVLLLEKITESSRAAKQLHKDMEGIRDTNISDLRGNIEGFDKLKTAIEQSNEGSLERQKLIEKMNSKYGDFLPNLLTEVNTVEQLNDAYAGVIQNMREYSYRKTKEQITERISKEQFETYNDAVNNLSKGMNSLISNGYKRFKLEKNEIQDIFKLYEDELTKNPDLDVNSTMRDILKQYTGITEAEYTYINMWSGYANSMKKRAQELKSLTEYAEDVVAPTYGSMQERQSAQNLRKKAEEALNAENEAWAKNKENLTKTIEASVLNGIKSARGSDELDVKREEGESDADFASRKARMQMEADEKANNIIKDNHIVTNYALEKYEKEHQAKLLKIRLDNYQISANEYKKQMLSIYPELDYKVKQYNDRIRDMMVNQFGSSWEQNAAAITMFRQMRIGIDDVSQGVEQYKKNFSGTLNNQKVILKDLYDWKELGYKIDEKDLDLQREKLIVYQRMARLLGVDFESDFIDTDTFNFIKKKFDEKFKREGKPLLSDEFTGLVESDRLVSQIDLLEKYTKKWKDYTTEVNTYQNSINTMTASGATAKEIESAKKRLEEAKINAETSKFLIDLLGYVASARSSVSQQTNDISTLYNLLKDMNSEYQKLSKSAYGFAVSNKKVMDSYKESFKKIFGVKKDTKGAFAMDGTDAFTMIDWNKIDITNKQGLTDALKNLKKYIDDNNLWKNFNRDASDKLSMLISQNEADIELDIRVRERADLDKEMEKLFSDYELTLDLEKLNLPADVAKDLLGIDYKDMSTILSRLTAFRDRLVNNKEGSHLSIEDQELYEKWLLKIDKNIYDIRKERAKEYTKYLEHELSERAKLEMQYATDVSYVKTYYASGEQKNAILNNLERNYTDALHELEWKSFKESDFYVEMMQDITSLPAEYLSLMMDKLNEWTKKADTLSPKVLKDILRAKQQIIEARTALSPLDTMKSSLDMIRKFQDSGATDAYGNAISRNIFEAKKQLDGIIVDRNTEIDMLKEQIALDEKRLGQLSAQENLIKNIRELTLSGIEDVSLTSNAEEDIKSYEAKVSFLEKRLSEIKTQERQEGESEESYRSRKENDETASRELNVQIELLRQIINFRRQAANIKIGDNTNTEEQKSKLLADILRRTEKIKSLEREQANFSEVRTAYMEWAVSVKAFSSNINTVIGYVKELGSQFYTTLSAVGVETDEVSDAWMDLGTSMVDTMVKTLEMTAALAIAFVSLGISINASLGVIGLIALAVQSVLTLVSGLSKIKDAGIEKEIERNKEKIDALTKAYGRLEEQINATVNTMSYLSTMNKLADNLNTQIASLRSQIASEQAKKKSDRNAIKEYEDAIQDAQDKLEELKKTQIETFGGIGSNNYRSAAEEFVSAWKEAFLSTGDGLDGLSEHFDEFLQEWFVKQATMRISGNMLSGLFEQIDNAVSTSGESGPEVNFNELRAIRERFSKIAPQLSDALEELAGMWGLGGKSGGLSGLAAGIQGMTEEKANILEAYWNSSRGYVASIDGNVARIADILGAGGVNTNPMLSQLKIIASTTSGINTILQSVVRSGHSMGGSGIKIFNN